MKIIQKNIVALNFSELEDDIKDQVIERYYQEEDYPFLTEDLLYRFSQEVCSKYMLDIKLCYDFGYSQGDGLSFSCDFDIDVFLKVHYPKMKSSLNAAICNYFNVNFLGNEGRYTFSNKDQVDYEFDYYYSNLHKKYTHFEKLCLEIFEQLQQEYVNVCDTLKKHGYDIIEYRPTYEEFQETCEANEYLFDIKGNILKV